MSSSFSKNPHLVFGRMPNGVLRHIRNSDDSQMGCPACGAELIRCSDDFGRRYFEHSDSMCEKAIISGMYDAAVLLLNHSHKIQLPEVGVSYHPGLRWKIHDTTPVGVTTATRDIVSGHDIIKLLISKRQLLVYLSLGNEPDPSVVNDVRLAKTPSIAICLGGLTSIPHPSELLSIIIDSDDNKKWLYHTQLDKPEFRDELESISARMYAGFNPVPDSEDKKNTEGVSDDGSD